MTRQKLFEIILTACLSALIAILQNLLASHAGNIDTIIDPVATGAIGGTLSFFRNIKSV